MAVVNIHKMFFAYGKSIKKPINYAETLHGPRR